MAEKSKLFDDADRLKQARERLGLSREELALALDRSEKTIKLVENGSQKLGSRAWAKLKRLESKPPPGSAAAWPCEVRESAAPYPTAPPGAADQLDRIAAIVADKVAACAVEAMVSAGIAPATAWRALIEAKLRESGP
jgi:DNA-binding XRE family transcriptional regulator